MIRPTHWERAAWAYKAALRAVSRMPRAIEAECRRPIVRRLHVAFWAMIAGVFVAWAVMR